MGRVLIEIGIPALILMMIAWKLTKIWFFSTVPKHLEEIEKIEKASTEYTKKLDTISKI